MKHVLRSSLLGLALLAGPLAQAQVMDPVITSWLLNTNSAKGFNNNAANVTAVKYSAGSVYVQCTDIPSYSAPYVAPSSGQGTATTNSWYPQPTTGPVLKSFTYRIPRVPVANTSGTFTAMTMGHNGVWINGTSIYSGQDAASYKASTGQADINGDGVWHTDAVVNEGVGFDNCNGHPDMTGEYHHHVNPTCLYDTRDSTRHSPIIGYAIDGYPIYGAYGYRNTDGTGGIKGMKSSFRLRSISTRTTLADGSTVTAGPAVSTTWPLGKFVEDNEYVAGRGDLDVHNGRWCVTPEYPAGTYAYFCTMNSFYEGAYPYTLGSSFYGVVPNWGNNNPSTVTIPASGITTYTPPTDLTVSTAKMLAGGSYANVTVTGTGNLLLVSPLTVTGALTVQSGGALDVGTRDETTPTISGAGSFSLASGARLKIDNPAGITSTGSSGSVQVTGTRTFDADADYVYESGAAQTTGLGLPAAAKSVTINNSSSTGVTLSQSLAVPAGGTLTLTDGQLITASGKNLTVNGTLVAGTEQVTGAGTFTLSGGATLKTGHASGIRTGSTGSIAVTGTRGFSDAASYEYNGTAAQVTSGSLPATVASLTISNGAGVTLTNGVTISSALTLTKGELKTNGKALTVSTGATASTGTSTITGTGSFTLSSGATLKTGHPDGLSSTAGTGAMPVTGARSLAADASYEYNGSTAQATGNALPATIQHLTVTNGAGVTLTSPVTVTGALTTSSGVLTTGANAVTLGPAGTIAESATSFVTGTVLTTRDLSTAGATTTFGGLGLSLKPIGSTLPGSTTVSRVTGTALSGQNNSVSIQRYYDIVPATNAGLNVTLEFSYRDTELNNLPESQLALFRSATGTNGPWQYVAASTRDAVANTVTATGVDHFSVWTLGAAATPLPVELVDFTAERRGAGVLLRWATASEKNCDRFEVEASADGRGFRHLGQVSGAGTSTSRHDYQFSDPAPARNGAPVVYYRLRQVDQDGTARYSPVRALALGSAAAGTLAVAAFPNPATPADQLHLELTAPADEVATLIVRDALGRMQHRQPVQLRPGSTSVSLPTEAAARLRPGVYSVQLQTKRGQASARLVWR